MLELISIHIPKTAGTSFEQTLKDVYGGKAILRIDHRPWYKGTAKFYSFGKKEIPEQIKVIHGHFNYHHLKSYINITENIPVITWLRDPVVRSISNFNSIRRVVYEDLKEANVKDKTYWKLQAIEKNVMEFSSKPGQRSLMARYLMGVNLEQLFFVGIVEHYTEDLAHLAKLLAWENFQEYKINISEKHKVNTKKRKIIKRYNKVDYNLYKQALYLRQKRAGILSVSDKITYLFHRTTYFIQRGLKNKLIYFIQIRLKR